jgi:hypothetical protein
VLVRPERALGAVAGFLSLEIDGNATAVIAFPSAAQIAAGGAFVGAAGETTVAVTAASGSLEETITAARRHLLTGSTLQRVVILEAPRYQPVVLEAGDTAVRARSVSIDSLQR